MSSVELTLHIQPEVSLALLEHQADAEGTVIVAGLSESQWQSYFEQWLSHLQPPVLAARSSELSLVLTTDADIQQLNTTYRQHNTPTDVLAFAALEGEMPYLFAGADLPLPLGDIVISVETAVRQSKQQGHGLDTELAWLSCHGLLHLLGWDHPDATRLTQMLTQQAELMTLIGFIPPVWTTQEFGYLH